MNKIGIQNEMHGKQAFCNSNIINICNSVLDNFSIDNSEINIIISNDYPQLYSVSANQQCI